jgi:TrmH family RNA methyltransferase
MHENKYPIVNHPRDPRFLTLLSLQTPQGRSRSGRYIIEGIRHLARAVEQNAAIESVFLDPSVLSNRFGQKLARRLRKRHVPGVRLSNQLYRDLTRASEPQGIGAVVQQQWTPLANVGIGRDSFWLAVESIESPGNLGTIIRTAEAASVSGIFVVDSESDPYDSAAVRASMGSLFSQKLTRGTPREFADWAKSCEVSVVGSSPAGFLDYKALRCRWPAALLIGSEKRGLSDHLAETADFMVRIPMSGGCDSINVSVAAGILLFELSSQRKRAPR